MTENEQDEELIQLNEIYEELRKDALDVTKDLLEGINAYKMFSYLFLILPFFFASLLLLFESKYPFSLSDWGYVIGFIALALSTFMCGVMLRRTHSKLKKKYSKLVEIEKTLGE